MVINSSCCLISPPFFNFASKSLVPDHCPRSKVPTKRVPATGDRAFNLSKSFSSFTLFSAKSLFSSSIFFISNFFFLNSAGLIIRFALWSRIFFSKESCFSYLDWGISSFKLLSFLIFAPSRENFIRFTSF